MYVKFLITGKNLEMSKCRFCVSQFVLHCTPPKKNKLLGKIRWKWQWRGGLCFFSGPLIGQGTDAKLQRHLKLLVGLLQFGNLLQQELFLWARRWHQTIRGHMFLEKKTIWWNMRFCFACISAGVSFSNIWYSTTMMAECSTIACLEHHKYHQSCNLFILNFYIPRNL